MGFIMHFYIIFGTKLLTKGPMQIAVFCLFQCFEEKEYQMESKRNEPSGAIFLEQTQSMRLGVDVKKQPRRPRGCRARPRGWACPPPSWAPRGSTDLLLSPIYTHIHRKHLRAPQNPISTAATFCTCEIPSWSLFRRSA